LQILLGVVAGEENKLRVKRPKKINREKLYWVFLVYCDLLESKVVIESLWGKK